MLTRDKKDYLQARIGHVHGNLEEIKNLMARAQKELEELRQILIDDLEAPKK